MFEDFHSLSQATQCVADFEGKPLWAGSFRRGSK